MSWALAALLVAGLVTLRDRLRRRRRGAARA